MAVIREFVHEYQRVPHGKKAVWVAEREFTHDMLRRWRSAVVEWWAELATLAELP